MSDDLTGRFEPYLGVVPILLLDGKNILKASEDDDVSWTLVCRIADALNKRNRVASELAEARDEIARLEQWRADATEVLAGLRLLDAPPTQPGGGTRCRGSCRNTPAPTASVRSRASTSPCRPRSSERSPSG